MPRRKKTEEMVFGWDHGFSKEYPKLADAVFTYEEFDFSGLVKAGTHSLRRDGPAIRCSYSRCHEGGYDLRHDIELMMSLVPRQTTRTIRMLCEGWDDESPTLAVTEVNRCTGSIEGTLQLKMRGKVAGRSKTPNRSKERIAKQKPNPE